MQIVLKWDRTMCLEEYVGWPHVLQMFYGNLRGFGKKFKVGRASFNYKLCFLYI